MALASDVVALAVTISGVVGEGTVAKGAQPFSEFIGFGDSNIDSGYFFTHPISNNSILEAQYQAAVAAGGGVPTSLGGAMNSTLLAEHYGLTAIPVGESGGTNYAASGATVTGTVNSSSLAPSIVSQIQVYLAAVNGQADPNALYLLSGGGNDAKVAATLSGTAAQEGYMVQQANTFAVAIEQLFAAGARNIVIGNSSGPGDLGKAFSDTLYSDLAAADVSFIPALIKQDVIQAVDANPAAYGITNTTQPAAGPFTTLHPYDPANGGADINPLPSLIGAGWARYATQLVSPNAGQTYLWADNEHLSAAGQEIEANYLFDLVQNVVSTVGETLSARTSVVGNTGGQFTYQWQSLGIDQSTWTDIAGATNSTFLVQQAEAGLQLRVETTYIDTSGASTAVSQAVSVMPIATAASSITAMTDTGLQQINAGHLAFITVNTSAAVTVTGTPTLQLNDNEVAYYTGGSGTNTLTFVYVPQPTDNVADLTVTGLNLPSGATILDGNGNSLSGPIAGDLGLNVAGTLTPATVLQEINALYVTLYGIAATQAGITFWENVLHGFDPNVTTANSASTAVSVNDEIYLGQQMTAGSPIVNGTTYFATLYPTSMTDMDYVKALYQNMSNFIGTVAGDNFWFNVLQQAESTNGHDVILARESVAGQFVHDFLSNDLTIGATALGVTQSDYTLLVNGQQTLLNRAVISQYYANETVASGGDIINFTTVTSPAFTAAHNVVAAVTNDPASAAAAITGINNAIAHQDLSFI